jgi:hypothetical protein
MYIQILHQPLTTAHSQSSIATSHPHEETISAQLLHSRTTTTTTWNSQGQCIPPEPPDTATRIQTLYPNSILQRTSVRFFRGKIGSEDGSDTSDTLPVFRLGSHEPYIHMHILSLVILSAGSCRSTYNKKYMCVYHSPLYIPLYIWIYRGLWCICSRVERAQTDQLSWFSLPVVDVELCRRKYLLVITTPKLCMRIHDLHGSTYPNLCMYT